MRYLLAFDSWGMTLKSKNQASPHDKMKEASTKSTSKMGCDDFGHYRLK